MMAVDRRLLQQTATQPVTWRGRSGHIYALSPERLEDFRFVGDELYLIALGPHVMWAGSASDVVHDATSRARLRLALDCADRVFHVETRGDEVERMTVVWDLEDATPLLNLSAA